MNYIDFFFIIVISLVTIRGVFRGLISELAILIAIILGFIISFTFLNDGVRFIMSQFPDLPEFAARILVFIALFLIVNIIIRLLSNMLNKFAKITFLQPVNKIAGGIFAFLKITIMLSILIILVEFIPFSEQFLNVLGKEESISYAFVRNFAPGVHAVLTAVLPGSESLHEKMMHTINSADSTAKELIKPF
jgi:membrane protein required for colicin V production